MNTAYWIAIVWFLLAVFMLKFGTGKNALIVAVLASASALASLLGVAVQYGLL